MRNSRPIAWLTAVAATLAVLAWQSLVVTYVWDGNWTGLFCAGSRFEVPPEAAAGLARVENSNGYDGQFYRLIARDPFLQRGWTRYVDDPRLRYRRVLIPAIAWLVAMGQDRFIDAAFIACILASVLLGVYWTSRWFADRGCSPMWGAVFLLVPATLASIDRMLLDGPLCAAFAGFVWYVSKGGPRPWLLLACASLIKETGVFLAAALLFEEVRARRWRRALLVALTQAPALAWFVFVQMHTPPSSASAIVESPVIGQIERVLTPRRLPGAPAVQRFIQTVDAAAVLGLLASCGIGLMLYYRCTDAVAASAVLFALLGLALSGTDHLQDAMGFSRPVSPLLWLLLVNGIAQRRWWMMLPPLTMTIAVGLYPANEALTILRRALPHLL